MSPEGASYGAYFGHSGLVLVLVVLPRGDALRACPGFHISRLWRFCGLNQHFEGAGALEGLRAAVNVELLIDVAHVALHGAGRQK